MEFFFCLYDLHLTLANCLLTFIGTAEKKCESLKIKRRCPPISTNLPENPPTTKSASETGSNASFTQPYSTTLKSVIPKTTESAGETTTPRYGFTPRYGSTPPYGTTTKSEVQQTTVPADSTPTSTRPYGT